jgi:hypothetical protein
MTIIMRLGQFHLDWLYLDIAWLIILTFAIPSGAVQGQEMPGNWQKTILCGSCPPPAGLAFDGMTGAIVLQTRPLGLSFSQTRVFSTTDGGESWRSRFDTITSFGIQRDFGIALRAGLLIVEGWGGTILSDDLGDSMEVNQRMLEMDYDFYAASSKALFRLKAPLQNERVLEYTVSRDSGKTYSEISTLELPAEDFVLSARIRDSNEIWTITGGNSTVSGPKLKRLHYSLDQGRNWQEVFPLHAFGTDTTGVRGGNSFFGNGGASTYEGLQPGSDAGSLYLVQNAWKGGTSERKFFDLIVTTDYGQSWRGDSSHTRSESLIMDVEFIRNPSESKLWMVTLDQQIVGFSPDNALTWVHDSVTFIDNPITHMLWMDSVRGYVLTHTADSTLTFWRFISSSAHAEHLDTYPGSYFRLPSEVASNGRLRVHALQPLAGELIVLDVLGRVVWRRPVYAVKSELLEFDLPLRLGVYFLTYTAESLRQSARFVQE